MLICLEDGAYSSLYKLLANQPIIIQFKLGTNREREPRRVIHFTGKLESLKQI
jgi:hypothetical protein